MKKKQEEKILENLHAIVGDIHGAYHFLRKLSIELKDKVDSIIQVGDFGYGFSRKNDKKLIYREKSKYKYLSTPVSFIRGNHDNKELILNTNFAQEISFILDGTIKKIGNSHVLFIGGAGSIDRAQRIEGLNWWKNEILSTKEQYDILDAIHSYYKKIDVVISHDCPAKLPIWEHMDTTYYPYDSYCEGQKRFLQEILEIVKPKKWFFGHYHKTFNVEFEGCNFQCLGINDFVLEQF